ncbi:hypothetical protein AUJ14_06195 [Candidatus Micrarchaeota archaeon CG1_02_55_22]|nr:MAG: hypothetical protein AUJ14_06195 [Candidatus Micrarchaeota archaeon CG1_02_55_22]
MNKPPHNARTLLLIIAIIVLALLPPLYAHRNNPLPLHADEYVHLALSQELAQTGFLAAANPYFAFNWTATVTQSEPLLQAVTVELSTLLDQSPLAITVLLPYLFSALFALAAYAAGNRYAGPRAGAFAALTAILFKTTLTVLGPSYAVPFALGATVFLLFMLAIESNNSALAAVLGAIAVFINPPLAAALVLGTFCFALFDRLSDKTNPFPLKIASALAVLLVLAMLPRLFFTGTAPADVIAQIHFPLATEDFAGTFASISLVNQAGFLVLVLSLLGAWHSWRTRKCAPLAFALPLAAITLLAEPLGTSPFLPYRRAAGYFAVAVLPLAAIGADALAKKISERFPKVKPVHVIILLALLLLAWEAPATARGLDQNYEYFSLAEAPIVPWLASDALKTGSRPTILASLRRSTAITPLSNNFLHVCGTVGAVLWPGPLADEMARLDEMPCDELRQLYRTCNASYYYADHDVGCWFATPVLASQELEFYAFELAP